MRQTNGHVAGMCVCKAVHNRSVTALGEAGQFPPDSTKFCRCPLPQQPVSWGDRGTMTQEYGS